MLLEGRCRRVRWGIIKELPTSIPNDTVFQISIPNDTGFPTIDSNDNIGINITSN